MNHSFRLAFMAIAFLSPLATLAGGDVPEAVTTTLIKTRPEGILHKNFVRQAKSFYSTGTEGADIDSVDYYVADYVVSEGGSVFLKNPFTYLTTGTYLKLDVLNGDTLVARLPQAIYTDEDGNVYYASRLVLKQTEQGQTYTYDKQQDGSFRTDVKFVMSNGQLTMLGDDGNADGQPKSILGLVSATGGWGEYGEAAFSVRPLDATAVTLPGGATKQLCRMSYISIFGKMTEMTELAFVGSDVYMANPFVSDSVQWIKGTVAGDKVTFASQYLGVNEQGGYHMFFCPGRFSENASDGYELAPELTFSYDRKAGTLTAADPQTLLINVGDKQLYYAAAYRAPLLTLSGNKVGKPSNPVISEFKKWGEADYNAGSVEFELPSTDANGQDLFKGNLYYRVYTAQGKSYAFSPKSYTNFDTERTDIAYGLSDNLDFFMQDDTHKFYFYDKLDSIGLQSVYKNGANELRSDIVWTTGKTTTGISAVKHQDANVVSTRYFDLSGRAVIPSRHGVVVRQRKLSDGSIRNEKIIK